MISNYQSLIVLINDSGQILSVLRNNFLSLDRSLFTSLGEHQSRTLSAFVDTIKQANDVQYKEIYYSKMRFILSGSKLDEYFLISMSSALADECVNDIMFKNVANYDVLKELHSNDKVDAGENGIYDSLTRLNNELVNAQRQIVKINQELKDKNSLLNTMAVHDQLTGVYNRQGLAVKYPEIMKLISRLQLKVCFVMIDLNDFKIVNDTLGHDEGDRLLKLFASIALKMTRVEYDFIFRVGGDEFLLILVDCDYPVAEKVCSRINDELQSNSEVTSISYGIVELSSNSKFSLDQCLQEADKRMYEYKHIHKSSTKEATS